MNFPFIPDEITERVRADLVFQLKSVYPLGGPLFNFFRVPHTTGER